VESPDPHSEPPNRRNRRRTRQERQDEVRYHAIIRIAELIASIVNNTIRWGGLCVIVYLVYRIIESLAGKTTVADIGIKFLADMKLSDVFAVLFGGGGVLYGLKQRQLARRKTEHFSRRQAQLEQRLDPQRSSSKLPPTGETRPEDQP